MGACGAVKTCGFTDTEPPVLKLCPAQSTDPRKPELVTKKGWHLCKVRAHDELDGDRRTTSCTRLRALKPRSRSSCATRALLARPKAVSPLSSIKARRSISGS